MTQPDPSRPDDGVSLDRIFLALSHPIRRRMLVSLEDHNPISPGEFAPDGDGSGEESLEYLEERLYHKHLPRLADAGFADWDREADTVSRGPAFESIRPLLEFVEDYRDELPDDWP